MEDIKIEMGDNDSKNTSVKETLAFLGSESNVHGISRIVSSRSKCLRFLWLIAFLSATTFGGLQVYSIITLFLDYPVKTDVTIGFEPLTFPAITICNMNIIKKSEYNNVESAVLKSILNGNYKLPTDSSITTVSPPTTTTTATTTTTKASLLGGLGSLIGTIGNILNPVVSTTTNLLDSVASTTLLGPGETPVPVESYMIYQKFVEEYQHLGRNERIAIGHKIDNMLLECQFGGKTCYRPVKSIVTYDYGNCFTFESTKYTSTSSGPWGGLTMTINLENHESFQEITEGYGLRLVLHEIGSFPLPSPSGMTISGGYETSLGIKLTKIKRQGYPYGNCEDPAEYLKLHGMRYSTQACIQMCWEDLAVARCNCSAGYLRSEKPYYNPENYTAESFDNSSISTCFVSENRDCYLRLRTEFLSDVSSYCYCPPPCTENVYSTTFSGRLWPHESKLEKLKNQSCATYNTSSCGLDQLNGTALSANFLKFHIYFEDLNYEEITQEPFYDITQVIADIGGSLGLCVGVSLLCVFELVEVFIQMMLVCKRKCCGKTRVVPHKGNRK